MAKPKRQTTSKPRAARGARPAPAKRDPIREALTKANRVADWLCEAIERDPKLTKVFVDEPGVGQIAALYLAIGCHVRCTPKCAPDCRHGLFHEIACVAMNENPYTRQAAEREAQAPHVLH